MNSMIPKYQKYNLHYDIQLSIFCVRSLQLSAVASFGYAHLSQKELFYKNVQVYDVLDKHLPFRQKKLKQKRSSYYNLKFPYVSYYALKFPDVSYHTLKFPYVFLLYLEISIPSDHTLNFLLYLEIFIHILKY